MRCVFRSAGGSCPRQLRKTPTACRCRQNKKHGNRRRLPDAATVRAVHEQIRAAAKIVRKTYCYLHVFHSQINVIKATRFHFRFSLRTISFNPDQVSSIAHTFTSTNPSGRATARTTSSVTSAGTPDDFFGQETQTVPVSRDFPA